MPADYKVLGQSQPAATTATDLYTVPSATQAICSTLIVCNTAASTNYRISVRPGGATGAVRHFIVYDNPIANNDSIFLTLGLTLGPADVVTVYAGSTGIGFSLFGTEIT